MPAREQVPCSALSRAGEAWVVASVLGDDDVASRLQACGLWPGAPVELITRAPFGDPLLLRVHGYRLALRRGEADRVLLQRAEPSA